LAGTPERLSLERRAAVRSGLFAASVATTAREIAPDEDTTHPVAETLNDAVEGCSGAVERLSQRRQGVDPY
jgi:hypothetical protein